MLLKIDYSAKDKKQFDEVHIDLPGLKASDPSLFASVQFANKKTGVISEAQLIPVTQLCDPEEGEELKPVVTKLEKTINHDKENAGQSPRKPARN